MCEHHSPSNWPRGLQGSSALLRFHIPPPNPPKKPPKTTTKNHRQSSIGPIFRARTGARPHLRWSNRPPQNDRQSPIGPVFRAMTRFRPRFRWSRSGGADRPSENDRQSLIGPVFGGLGGFWPPLWCENRWRFDPVGLHRCQDGVFVPFSGWDWAGEFRVSGFLDTSTGRSALVG